MLYMPTKGAPLLKGIYSLEANKQSMVFDAIGKLVNYAKQATTYDLVAYNMYMAPYTNTSLNLTPNQLDCIITNATSTINYAARSSPDAMDALTTMVDSSIYCFDTIFNAHQNQRLTTDPMVVVEDLMFVAETIATHVSNYNTYNGLVYGFNIHSIDIHSTPPPFIIPAAADVAQVLFVPQQGIDGMVGGAADAVEPQWPHVLGVEGGGVGGGPLASPASPVLGEPAWVPTSPEYVPYAPEEEPFNRYRSPSPPIPWYAH